MNKKRTNKKRNHNPLIIGRFDKSFEYLGVLQLLFMAGSYAYLWFYATEVDARKVYAYSVLMVFEFIMVHSGIFMAMMPAKVSLLIFFPFYGIFALVFNMIMREADYTILTLYLTTVFNRMRFAFFEKNKQIISRNVIQSVGAGFIYFFLTFFVLVFDFIIPEFALDEAFFQTENYDDKKGFFIKGSAGIVFGTLYFSILALLNYYIIRKKTLII